MRYKHFLRLYSYQRVNRYYRASHRDKRIAVERYIANDKVSQAFYPLLGALEVILRNQLHYALAGHFDDREWIINQKGGFMANPTLSYTMKNGKRTGFLLGEVQKAEKKLQDKGVTITAGRIIAEQSFGFWNSLFDKKTYAVLEGVPLLIFKNRPASIKRKQINNILVEIRELRNRISHHEPICLINRQWDFSYVERLYHTIIDFMDWIDEDASPFLIETYKIKEIIDEQKSKTHP